MANVEGQTNTFILLKSFDHLNSSQATKAASRKRTIKRIQRVLASAQPIKKCSNVEYCFSMQVSSKHGVLFTMGSDYKVFEIDNSFKVQKVVVQGISLDDIVYASHVVSQRYTVGGYPSRKVNVFDNETKQVVYRSTKNMINIKMPGTNR